MKISDQIRLRIESAIATGELEPGDAIDDAALASQHKVSRTPVREALLQLQAQGILSNTPRGGYIVAKMNLQQLLSLWGVIGRARRRRGSFGLRADDQRGDQSLGEAAPQQPKAGQKR